MTAVSLVIVKFYCALYFSSGESTTNSLGVGKHGLVSALLWRICVEFDKWLHFSFRCNGSLIAKIILEVWIKMHWSPKARFQLLLCHFLGMVCFHLSLPLYALNLKEQSYTGIICVELYCILLLNCRVVKVCVFSLSLSFLNSLFYLFILFLLLLFCVREKLKVWLKGSLWALVVLLEYRISYVAPCELLEMLVHHLNE